jgi:hypothetical protein
VLANYAGKMFALAAPESVARLAETGLAPQATLYADISTARAAAGNGHCAILAVEPQQTSMQHAGSGFTTLEVIGPERIVHVQTLRNRGYGTVVEYQLAEAT